MQERETKESGAKLHPALVSGIITGDAPVTNWRLLFHVISNNPRSLNSMQFPFRFLSDKCPGGSCSSCSEAESQLVCYTNWKTMVKNDLPLSERKNQERPYEQLPHYWSRHLQVGLEQFCTSLFNQHLGVLVSVPQPHLHPKIS